jgi:hypothetical protein
VNAHPPTSVLLALPLAQLDFPRAFLLWNLATLALLTVSLAIVQCQLKIPFDAWSIGPLLALLLVCHPVWEHVYLGQITLVVTLLVTGAWAAERSGRPRLAGALVGAATAVKLFPGFLVLYFAWRRQWRVVGAGLVAFGAFTGLTVAVLGLETYRSYVRDVIPAFSWFQIGWNNMSLFGFWGRLFDPLPGRERSFSLTDPLWHSPFLAQVTTWASATIVLGLLARVARPEQTRERSDRTFGLAATAMLLLSPIAWDHYLLILLAPLAVFWVGLPPTRSARVAFLALLAAFWIGPEWARRAFSLAGRVATPVDALVVLPIQCYALLGLFALGLFEIRGRSDGTADSPGGAMALGAVVMAAMWMHIIDAYWHEHGMFHHMGWDFAIFRSIAMGLVRDGPGSMYALGNIGRYLIPLTVYSGPDLGAMNVGPGPYPPVYFLPFVPLTWLSAPAGFLLWTGANLCLVVVVARGLTARFWEGTWGLTISAVLFYPIMDALFYGQAMVVWLFALDRAYRAFENATEFRAGLWLGLLLLKPQLVIVLAMVLLCKRRWQAIGGLAVSGSLLLLSSWAIAGIEGLRGYRETLRLMGGFRMSHDFVNASVMISWRGFLTSLLPADVSETTRLLLTLVLSGLSFGVLLAIWRGPWNPRSDRFPSQMLVALIVTMLVGFHNHIHGAALLLVPGMVLAARGGGPWPLPFLLVAALYSPLVVLFFTGSPMLVAWLFIALMVAALVSLIVPEFTRALPVSSIRKENWNKHRFPCPSDDCPPDRPPHLTSPVSSDDTTGSSFGNCFRSE